MEGGDVCGFLRPSHPGCGFGSNIHSMICQQVGMGAFRVFERKVVVAWIPFKCERDFTFGEVFQSEFGIRVRMVK